MKRLTRIFLWFIVGILALVGLVIVFVQSPTGQDFITKQAVTFLRKKLGTPVVVDKVRFRIPDWVTLEGVYVPDLKKDTLLYGKRLHVDLDMLGLLSGNVKLNQIELESIRAKVIRTLPDTTFNFNYILDAFMSKDEKVDTTSSSDPFDISLKRVKLNNVRITYNDAIIGTDADLYLKNLSTEFKEFNIAKSQYHFANIKGDGGAAKLRLYKSVKPSPVAPSTTVPPEVAAADTLDLNVGTVNLANFDWQLESEEDGMRNSVKLGKLELEGDKIYLNGQKIIFKKIALENTEAFVEMANKPEPAPTKKTQTQPAKKPEENNTDTGPGWTAILGNVEVNKVRLKYDDKYAPRQTKGLDYGHLDVSNLAIVLKNFTYSPDRIAGQLAKGTFTEQSGLNLQSLTTNFTYSNKEIGLRNLFLKTPQTVIRDEMVMQYDTIADLSNNLGNVRVKVNIKQSQVAMKDVLLLVPDLAKNPTFKNNQNDIIKADGIITGKVNNLSVPKLSITGFGATRVLAKGNITGLPDPNKLGFNLDITEVSTTKQDIIKLAGADAIPESIELPEKIALRGKLRGKADDLQVDASLESDLGGAVFTGKLQNFVKGQNQAYDGKLTLEEFDAGKLIKQPENVGKLTLEVNAKGTGIDPKTMNASIDGTAKKAVLKGYEYNNLILKGDINNQIANINASLDDPNADFNLLAKADLSKEFPGVEGNVSINNIDLKKLNLYAEDLKIKGDIKLDMASTDPKNPSGTVSINKAVIEMGGKVIPIDTTNLQIQNLPEGRNIVLKSPIVNAEVGGTFDFERVLDMVLTEVNKYFKIPDVPYTPVTEGYDIHINAKVNQHPIIQSFVPELTKLETISFVAEIDNRKDTTMQATVIVPLVEYDSSSVRNANLKLYATGNKATYNGAISQINVSDFSIKRTSLNGEIADNTLTTKVVLKDSLNKDQYALAARLKSEEGKYRMNLSSRGTLIDYKEWRSDSTGYIEYGPQGLLVKQFLLEQNGQKLLVNSATNEPNSPIDVKIDSLNIKPFVTIATLDSTLAGGTLNGDLKLSNYMTSPVFTGDLVINNLTVTQIPVGNLALNANNETADVIAAKVSLTNDKNDIQVHGNYLTKQKEALDLTVDINKLGAETVKAFSFGQIKSADGNLSGKLAIKGEPTKPRVSGELKFDDVSLSLTQLGSKYIFNNQVLTFNDSDLRFNNFVIADTLGQKLTVNGKLNLQNIPEFNYKLQVNAANFMALNGSRKDNDFFYGKGFIDANLNITGVGAKPSIDGTVKLKEGSDITVILPDESISETETDGVVEFINMKNPEANAKSDSTELATNFNDVASEMALNIEVDDKSQLSIVIDEVNGDNLKIKGNAQLNTGITPSGEFYLFGLYELTSGQYDLTFQVLKRQFTIEKGSNLLWTGDPMKAQIDITAAYPLTADLTSLNDEARLYGKVPVKVLLKMQGNLSSPDISFDIVLDEALASSDVKNFVENRALFANFKNDPVAMNKEVFSLLILNRFSGQQSSDFFSGTNAEAIARQSVSKLLTDQLNVLAGDLIKGVKLDFNLNSNFQPAQSGTGVRTDLNVGLSKGFLNDRLTVSVGRNFQIENTTGIQKNSTEIFDNIALNYNLTKDGRYMFRAFRKNEFFILDGYVQETGVSFALTINYETFKELFTKQK